MDNALEKAKDTALELKKDFKDKMHHTKECIAEDKDEKEDEYKDEDA